MIAKNCGHEANTIKVGFCSKCYHVKNAENQRLAVKTWKAKNPEKAKAITKAWRDANSDKVSAYYKKYNKKRWSGIVGKAALRSGLTAQEYEDMFVSQKGVCAICRLKDSKQRLAVDHNHKTGKIRGLLCGKCNKGLGLFDDAHILLTKASQYLRVREEVLTCQ